MEKLEEIYETIDKENIYLKEHELDSARGILVNYEDVNAIIIDNNKLPESKSIATVLAHELGHYNTSGYYERTSPFDLISKKEYKADKNAWDTFIGYDELKKAVRNGYNTIWELSEYFGFEENFIARAVFYYQSNYGDIA